MKKRIRALSVPGVVMLASIFTGRANIKSLRVSSKNKNDKMHLDHKDKLSFIYSKQSGFVNSSGIIDFQKIHLN
jgi:hypothetical protein